MKIGLASRRVLRERALTFAQEVSQIGSYALFRRRNDVEESENRSCQFSNECELFAIKHAQCGGMFGTWECKECLHTYFNSDFTSCHRYNIVRPS